jgi:hypothetical protein
MNYILHSIQYFVSDQKKLCRYQKNASVKILAALESNNMYIAGKTKYS